MYNIGNNPQIIRQNEVVILIMNIKLILSIIKIFNVSLIAKTYKCLQIIFQPSCHKKVQNSREFKIYISIPTINLFYKGQSLKLIKWFTTSYTR